MAEWEESEPLATPRFGMASLCIEEKAYFIGGNPQQGDSLFALDEVLVYNCDTRHWETQAPSLNVPRSGATAVQYDMAIYVFGGKGQEDDEYVSEIEVLLPNETDWQIAGNLSPERTGMCAVVLNDTIYVTGGYNHLYAQNTYSNEIDAFVLDPLYNDGTLRAVESRFCLPSPRSNHAVVGMDSLLLMFGGYYAGGSLGDCYLYNGIEWIELESLDYSVSAMGFTSILTNRGPSIITMGGLTHTGETARGLFTNYPFGHWLPFEDNLPFERSNHSLVSFKQNNNTILLLSAGGSYDDGILLWPLDDVQINEIDLNNLVVVERNQNSELPAQFDISAYPNPFNSMVTISVNMKNLNNPVDIRLLNLLGRELKHWILEPSNNLRFSWDGNIGGKPAAAGLYFMSANNGNEQQTVKIYRLP